MALNIKALFEHYLIQLVAIIEKIPEDLFSKSLTKDMLPLEQNAKIVCNFALRGYCPLVGRDVVSLQTQDTGKVAVQKQLSETLTYLANLPDAQELDETLMMEDKAGFTDVRLPQPLFIHQYILPNFIFHLSMVYAIAKANDVILSKADFDGIHSYPVDFSFVR